MWSGYLYLNKQTPKPYYVRLAFFPFLGYNKSMTQTKIPVYVDDLIVQLYEDNFSHFEFIDNMNGGDCDCAIHNAMNIIYGYVRD
jgi:hypothetical protein